MFNKNDPLIDSVSKIMKENQIRRDVEQALNEELGIHSKKDLPFQSHAEYDAVLEEAIQEALKGNQHKIDLNKNKRIDSHDFKLLRAKKEKKPEEHGVEAEREMASKGQKMYESEHEKENEKLDEVADTAKGKEAVRRAVHRADARVVDAAVNKPKGKTEKREFKNAMKTIDRGIETHKKRGNVLDRYLKGAYGLKKEESEESDPAVSNLQEKAVSKAQQRFFGLVRGIQKGEAEGSDEAEKAAAKMSTKEVRKFAKTKQKGLPEKVKEDISIDSIMEEIRANLNEKAKAMLEAPFHEAAAWFNSLDEEQIAMLDEKIMSQSGANAPAQISAGVKPDTNSSFMNALKGVATGGGTGTPAAQNAGPTSLAVGGASLKRPEETDRTPVVARAPAPAPAPTRSISVADPAPTPAPKPASPSSEVAASRAANVPDSRTLRAPVKTPAGEGKVGQGLAATGVSRQDRRNQAFVDKTLGAGKYKAGSAQANMALLAKSRADRAAVLSTEKPTRVNPATKLTTGGSVRE